MENGKEFLAGIGLCFWKEISTTILCLLVFLFNSGTEVSAATYNTTGLFDNDALPDAVVASDATNKIQIYLSATSTTFSMTNPNTPKGIAAGSLNNATDTFDDLVVLDALADGTTVLSIHYGNHAGTLSATPSKQLFVPTAAGGTVPDTIISVTAKDLNGDGRTDLILALAPLTSGGDPRALIALQNADGTFTNTAAYPPVGSNFTLTVTKAGTGTGTVTSSPAGINCGATCSASYAPATGVTLTAVQASGSTFAGWSGGGCSGTGACTVTMNANTAITATFNTQNQTIATITVTPSTATLSVKNNQTQQYTAVATDSAGSTIPGVTFTWASSNTAVCTVNSTGLATPVAKGGPANITATSGGVTGTATCNAIN